MSVEVPPSLSHFDGHNLQPPPGGYEEVIDVPGPFSRLLVFAQYLLEQHRKEKEVALKDCSSCLIELVDSEHELASALQMCKRAHLRVTILHIHTQKSGRSLSPQSSDSGYGDSEAGDANYSIYDDILATLEESDALACKRLQFQSFLEVKTTPSTNSMLEVAIAIVEESYARKTLAERKVERCRVQYHMHEADFKRAENACAAAERAIATLSTAPYRP
ncbi:hypothetical protein BJ138DRAFT_1119358 [Hygrophoropsis aurantiaca]|uniref:Uncharacterized protein n=1 Tax=Hygrophoropsis aurantiaca TaxID=72124 RepID=A0ACB7ZUU8_9AGAM|nr:hypothetical protein BJ138DRAFT_1119358 [Hygrophoropsis aurantiaca]